MLALKKVNHTKLFFSFFFESANRMDGWYVVRTVVVV